MLNAAQIPLALYVHLPWCVRKCPYCDFNSYSVRGSAPKDRYVDALLRDIEIEAEYHKAEQRQLVSVFLGGGTPSLFSAVEIGRILDGVAAGFGLGDSVEVTLEANPGAVECDALAGYAHAGVNRISIGAQSFSQDMLTRIGRIHTPLEIVRAVEAARVAGFERINLDLMYALPGQSVEMAVEDISQALALEPTHLSWYQLTLEPNTVFHARPPPDLPDEELCFAMQTNGQAVLEAAALSQYEVSAYAREGDVCVHNLNYWSFGDYVAVGCGAHGKVSDCGGVRRYAKPANPESYMRTIEAAPTRGVPPALESAEVLFEFLLNALRLTAGFDEQLFEVRTGLTAAELRGAAAPALARGLLCQPAAGYWQPTTLGRRFLNDLQALFLPEDGGLPGAEAPAVAVAAYTQ